MALRGIRVVELAGLAPAPFCGMLLADFGASVIRVDKMTGWHVDRLTRGKRSIALDLKQPQGLSILHQLCSQADVLIEPYRPGVMEKLGLGPAHLLQDNPRLVYARLSGYGQSGPMSQRAGHDINYLAISGVLSALGRKDSKPTPPINLAADFAGGGLLCAFGILAALLERQTSGKGQVIDANMVEGAAYVGSWIFRSQDMPLVWPNPGRRGENLLDTGFPLYDTYETEDGKFVAVGALEPQFQAELLDKLGLKDAPSERDVAKAFRSRTRAEWTQVFANSDACVTPVLELDEAAEFPHNKERQSFTSVRGDGGVTVMQPNPAPKLSRTTAEPSTLEPEVGQHSVAILKELGLADNSIQQLVETGVVGTLQSMSKL